MASRSSTEERVILGDKLVIARVAYVVVEVLTNRKEPACENLGFIYVKDGVYYINITSMWLLLKDPGMSEGKRAVKGNEQGDRHEMNRCREYEQDFIVDAFDEEFWFRVMNLEYKLNDERCDFIFQLF